MKYITVKLTEDQASYIVFLVGERVGALNTHDFPNEHKQRAFCKRIKTALAKAKTV